MLKSTGKNTRFQHSGIFISSLLILNPSIRVGNTYMTILVVRCVRLTYTIVGPQFLVLIQKNGDDEVEASFTEHEVASEFATGLTYYNVEWKQRPDKRRK